MSALTDGPAQGGAAVQTIDRDDVTGLVVCGGRGTRMGGVDKGLQLHDGVPLALHALRRLAPQVGRVIVNANRHLDAYAALAAPFGAPVCADTFDGYVGPLAGWAAGLEHCATRYLATVPCDTPLFPADLVQRLAAALAAQPGARIAMAAARGDDGRVATQQAFCLVDATLRDSLVDYLRSGERKVIGWISRHPCAQVVFDDAAAFFNANTPADLQRLGAR